MITDGAQAKHLPLSKQSKQDRKLSTITRTYSDNGKNLHFLDSHNLPHKFRILRKSCYYHSINLQLFCFWHLPKRSAVPLIYVLDHVLLMTPETKYVLSPRKLCTWPVNSVSEFILPSDCV